MPIVSPNDFKDELKKMTPANTAMQNGREGCERGLNITQRTRANEAMLREPEVVFPREEHNNWLFQCRAVTYTSKIVHSKQIHMRVFIYAYVSTYIYIYISAYVTTVNERDYECKV